MAKTLYEKPMLILTLFKKYDISNVVILKSSFAPVRKIFLIFLLFVLNDKITILFIYFKDKVRTLHIYFKKRMIMFMISAAI